MEKIRKSGFEILKILILIFVTIGTGFDLGNRTVVVSGNLTNTITGNSIIYINGHSSETINKNKTLLINQSSHMNDYNLMKSSVAQIFLFQKYPQLNLID